MGCLLSRFKFQLDGGRHLHWVSPMSRTNESARYLLNRPWWGESSHFVICFFDTQIPYVAKGWSQLFDAPRGNNPRNIAEITKTIVSALMVNGMYIVPRKHI